MDEQYRLPGAELLGETDKAVWVRVEIVGGGTLDLWLPKSQADFERDAGGKPIGELYVSGWLVDKKEDEHEEPLVKEVVG